MIDSGLLDSARRLRLMACALVLFAPLAAHAQSTETLRAYQDFETAKAANQVQDALKHGDEAVKFTQADGDKQSLVELLRSLGDYAASVNRDPEAVQYYGRALALQETELGADHPDLVPLLSAMADLSVKDRRYPDAEAQLQRILGIERSVYGDRNVNVTATQRKLREVYTAANDAEGVARMDAELKAHVAQQRSLGPPAARAPRYQQNNGFATVRVFYGTNRAPSGDLKPALFYGAARERGDLNYGYLDVTIPQIHEKAELEEQPRWDVTLDVAELRKLRAAVERAAAAQGRVRAPSARTGGQGAGQGCVHLRARLQRDLRRCGAAHGAARLRHGFRRYADDVQLAVRRQRSTRISATKPRSTTAATKWPNSSTPWSHSPARETST